MREEKMEQDGTNGQSTRFQSNYLDSRSNVLDVEFHVVDLLDEETFAPETLTAQEVRELLGIPRGDRWGIE